MEKEQAGHQQAFKDGKVFDFELNLKHISGTGIPVLYNASVYKDDEDEIIGVFAVQRQSDCRPFQIAAQIEGKR
jgi:hypothetical protein